MRLSNHLIYSNAQVCNPKARERKAVRCMPSLKTIHAQCRFQATYHDVPMPLILLTSLHQLSFPISQGAVVMFVHTPFPGLNVLYRTPQKQKLDIGSMANVSRHEIRRVNATTVLPIPAGDTDRIFCPLLDITSYALTNESGDA